MSTVRQLPKLYLRGSIANVTMAGLTAEQRQHMDEVVRMVANHPIMRNHKNKFIHHLRTTIAGDYKDAKEVAENDFKIAIWRCAVNLFYHCDYSFRCQACNSTTYLTKRQKEKPINRIQTPCPNCNKVRISDAGSTNYVTGQFVDNDEFIENGKDYNDWQKQPKCESTIVSVGDAKKYQNPQDILDNPDQMNKFFGEFIKNYSRQHVKENQRAEHGKSIKTKIITIEQFEQFERLKDKADLSKEEERQVKAWRLKGYKYKISPADRLYADETVNLCRRMLVKCYYNPKDKPENGRYHIRIAGLQTTPEFTHELCLLRQAAAEHGVVMIITNHSVMIEIMLNAPELAALINEPEHVLVLDNNSGKSDNETDYTINSISRPTIGGNRMDYDNHVAIVDFNDGVQAVRESIPDGPCKSVYDILSQHGELYYKFSERFGDGEPKISHMSTFLGVTPRVINNAKQTIKLTCLAKRFIPECV